MNTCKRLFNAVISPCGVIPGKGADLSKPPCRKAKDIRKEYKLQKHLQNQIQDPTFQPEAQIMLAQKSKPKRNQAKSIEDFIFVTFPPETVHQLEVFICAE